MRPDWQALTPQRCALIWKYIRPDSGAAGGILVVLPFGTAYFRLLQRVISGLPGVAARARFERLRPRVLALGPAAARTWELLTGHNTVGEIAAMLTAQAPPGEAWEGAPELAEFLTKTADLGLVNLDHPRPPRAGYEELIVRELNSGSLQGLLPEPDLVAAVRERLQQREQTLLPAIRAARP